MNTELLNMILRIDVLKNIQEFIEWIREWAFSSIMRNKESKYNNKSNLFNVYNYKIGTSIDVVFVRVDQRNFIFQTRF